jgi:hypothetical protein
MEACIGYLKIFSFRNSGHLVRQVELYLQSTFVENSSIISKQIEIRKTYNMHQTHDGIDENQGNSNFSQVS